VVSLKAASHVFQRLVNGVTCVVMSRQFGTMFTEPAEPHSLQTMRRPIVDQGRSWGRVSSLRIRRGERRHNTKRQAARLTPGRFFMPPVHAGGALLAEPEAVISLIAGRVKA
jgi:hypothetical protein